MKRTLALILSLVMCLGLFAGCGDKTNQGKENTPLVVGYAPFNEKFSPFFSETAYDQDVYLMTQPALQRPSGRDHYERYRGRNSQLQRY